jgi:hypothetical protein
MKATQMQWMYTTLQHGRGRQLSSAWRADYFLLHRLGTWPYLPGGTQDVRLCSSVVAFWLLQVFRVLELATALCCCYYGLRLLPHTIHCRLGHMLPF